MKPEMKGPIPKAIKDIENNSQRKRTAKNTNDFQVNFKK